MKWLAIAVCMCIFSWTSSSPVSSMEAKTEISVSPALVEVAASPGDSVSRRITIRNGGSGSLPLDIEVQSLMSYEGYINDQKGLSDASTWISVSEQRVVLAPLESAPLDVDFRVPDAAAPGGHYAQIAIRALTLEASGSRTTVSVPEITVSVFLNVAGDIEESFDLLDEGIFPQFVSPSSKTKLTFRVENNGNTHGLVTPVVVIQRNGNELGRQQLSSQLILPNTSRSFTEEWLSPSENGLYTAHIEFTSGAESSVIGLEEKFIVGHTVQSSVFLFLVVLMCGYLTLKRRNISRAVKVIIGKT